MKSRPDEVPRSPIPFGELSNGEIAPRAPDAGERRTEAEVHRVADRVARRIGMSRRDVLRSQLGTAVALATIDLAACGRGERFYDVPSTDSDALCDPDGVRSVLSGEGFVFDVQTHHVDGDPQAPWLGNAGWVGWIRRLAGDLGCSDTHRPECLARAAYIDYVFHRSDTHVAVLTTPPAPQDAHLLDNEHIGETRALVNERAASRRLLVHAGILPNSGEGTLDNMAAITTTLRPDAWKIYTQWGPDGAGFFLDDETVGIPFLERVMAVDTPKIVCVHKGLPFSGFPYAQSSPRDIGPASKLFPDVQLVVYHSGRDQGHVEGPYTKATADLGSNRLVRTLVTEGIAPNSNVWAELGSAWNALVTKPEQAAHLLGKLLKYVGEDRVLWGTDCIWYGSPQPFIEAFRAFEIPASMQEAHSYPALTPERKAKILGLNAAKLHGIDPDAVLCTLADEQSAMYRAIPRTQRPQGPAGFGPRSRRELLRHWARHGGRPG